MQQMTWEEFSRLYCERQQQTVEGLKDVLLDRVERFQPVGFMLLQCELLDSSRLGEYTILPYGPNSTYKELPNHPVSPRGLASDTSVVKGWIPVSELHK